MTGVSEWSETWVQVDTSYAHFWSPSNERSESRCCKETDQNEKGKKSKHFRRENQLLGSDTCLILFPGHVGMQSQNETKWQREQHSAKLIVSAYQHDSKMLLHFPFIETEKKRKKRREKKLHILRAGFEPATYGWLFHYSPPLYQLSYRRTTDGEVLTFWYVAVTAAN